MRLIGGHCGPCLRVSGVGFRHQTDESVSELRNHAADFDVPVEQDGDVWARLPVRMREFN